MITWIGFLGKILSFLAEKLASKTFDSLGDKKALAAESLIRIYCAIAELEGLTTEVLDAAKHDVETGESRLFVSSILMVEDKVEAQTTTLTDSLITVAPALEIFDPNLLETVGCICAWKYNILHEASRSMVLEREEGGHRLVRLRFKEPSDRIFELDLESHYQWLQTDPQHVDYKAKIDRYWSDRSNPEGFPGEPNWENLEWPQRLLMRNDLDRVFKDSEIDLAVSEVTIVREFAEKLEKHLKLLSIAREKLKTLIKEKLSIDDVLYVSSKIRS